MSAAAEVAPIPTPSVAQTAERIGQATAVEQARAVAEVQAAVVVAQQCPRDMDRAVDDMRNVCDRLGLANKAFYRVPNRGNGPSVHLARELARIWGNVQYGVHELRRDDEHGQSEVQAFAWDVQTNTRSTRTFIVPHARMRSGNRVPLTDLGDVYLNNQNVGARAVRECIFTVIPTWFTDEAEQLCRATLERGDGQPLAERIQQGVDFFAAKGVKVDQLEGRLNKKRAKWDEQDVATLVVISQSLDRGEMTIEEEFPPARVTAAEIRGEKPSTAAETSRPATPPPAADPSFSIAPAQGYAELAAQADDPNDVLELGRDARQQNLLGHTITIGGQPGELGEYLAHRVTQLGGTPAPADDDGVVDGEVVEDGPNLATAQAAAAGWGQ